MISASGVVNRSGSDVTPREVFSDLCGLILTGESRKDLAFTREQQHWIHKRENNFVLVCLHPPQSPTREAVCRSSGKNQARRYLEYTQNTASGRGSPATPYLKQCLFGDTEERYHQPIDRSGLTPATRLQ
ncbi:hypothetical protein TNCV_1441211 [Trichonephila clavipes]|uniref:Uncharacterized protein n=1 Tax=Trichonephila clavipes TaxID=2585209 RepID=A0A8X6RJH4_TRICX|nr:hypothetical protein TNCV_1441211 [Trichonephila clavipes]